MRIVLSYLTGLQRANTYLSDYRVFGSIKSHSPLLSDKKYRVLMSVAPSAIAIGVCKDMYVPKFSIFNYVTFILITPFAKLLLMSDLSAIISLQKYLVSL